MRYEITTLVGMELFMYATFNKLEQKRNKKLLTVSKLYCNIVIKK